MLEVNVNIKAPELAGAIGLLAAALGQGRADQVVAPVMRQPAPVAQAAQQPVPVAQTAAQAVTPVTQRPVPVAQAEAQAVPPVTQQPVPAVPVAAAPTYNHEQIMGAGAALIDAGKVNELMGLLNAFGVQAVTQLKQEQLGAFATELRKLGAQI